MKKLERRNYNGKWLGTSHQMDRGGEGLAQVHGAVSFFPVKELRGQLTGYPVGWFTCFCFFFLLVGKVHGAREIHHVLSMETAIF